MKKPVMALSIALGLVLVGCGPTAEDTEEGDPSSEGVVPEQVQEAESPEFAVGSKAVSHADHMEGMDGAEVTIDGVYNTTVYSITYTPTDGGDKVTDHKWVIHEELEDPEKEPLDQGTEVTVLADHMEGMKGATAEIESAQTTTVYMVDYEPTTGGDEVKNHKWVIESELSKE